MLCSWGSQSWLQSAFSRLSCLAVRGMQAVALCGRQSCLQAAFQAAVDRPLTQFAAISSDFVSCRHPAAQPGKFVACLEGEIHPAI